MQLLSLWVFLCSWKTLLISQWYIHKKENRTEDFLAGAYYVFFHLFVVNQKELCVRSCLMANPDLQLLFSHTYLSFSAHPRTQSRCRCHNRPESLLLRARDCYTARSLRLASSKANQTNRKSCLLLTSDDLKPVYRLKKQKKKKSAYEISSCLLQAFWAQQPLWWKGSGKENNCRKCTIFFLFSSS